MLDATAHRVHSTLACATSYEGQCDKLPRPIPTATRSRRPGRLLRCFGVANAESVEARTQMCAHNEEVEDVQELDIADFFKPDYFTGEHVHFYVLKSNPNDKMKGQKLHLEAHPTVGFAKNYALKKIRSSQIRYLLQTFEN